VPDLPTYLGFIAAVLLMQVVPGPDTILVAARGMGQGLRVALATVFGMTVLAGIIQLPLLASGSARSRDRGRPSSTRSAWWAPRIWYGLRAILKDKASREALPRDTPPPLRAAIQGMVINLMNPHPLIFMLAFLPQFVDPAQDAVATQLLVLGATQKVTGSGVLGLVALASARLGDRLAARPRSWNGRRGSRAPSWSFSVPGW
jgi:threonine/homoserine/homoserine lactone efflux protein